MTEKIGQIGYNPSSLFNAQDILKIGKLLDVRPNVSSIWIPESWGREAFVMLGAIAAITKKIKLRNFDCKHVFQNTRYIGNGRFHLR